MTFRKEDQRLRDVFLTTIEQATKKFSKRSCLLVSRNPRFKEFLNHLGTEEPAAMRCTLTKILRNIPMPSAESKYNAGKKRSLVDAVNAHKARNSKRVKKERTRSYGERLFGEKWGTEVRGTLFDVVPTDSMPSKPPELMPARSKSCADDNDSEEELFVNQDEEREYADDNPLESPSYTAYQIEIGLSRGTTEICQHFLSKFAKIPGAGVKDGSRILKACEGLVFEHIIHALSKFFRNPPKASNPFSPTCDVKDPSKILDLLKIINRQKQEPMAHRAFAEMKLFCAVNSIKAYDSSDVNGVLDMLAKRDMGAAAAEAIQERANEYRKDYNKGQNWLEISEYFGGTGIVFIFVAVGMHMSTVVIGALSANVTRHYRVPSLLCLDRS